MPDATVSAPTRSTPQPPTVRRMVEAVARHGRYAVFIHGGAPTVYEVHKAYSAADPAALCVLLGAADSLPPCYLRMPALRRCLEIARDEIAARRALTVPRRVFQATAPVVLLVLVLLAAAPAAAVDTVEAYALGVSYHFKPDADYSGWNPGAGIGLGWDLVPGVECVALGLAYRDSLRQPAVAAGIGGRITIGDRAGWHGAGTVCVGWVDGSGIAGPMALPVLGVGYGPVSVEVTGRPDGAAACVAAWLRLSWRLN